MYLCFIIVCVIALYTTCKCIHLTVLVEDAEGVIKRIKKVSRGMNDMESFEMSPILSKGQSRTLTLDIIKQYEERRGKTFDYY